MESIIVNSNVTTLDLSGSEIAVKFGTGHAYYQITNKSDTDFYVSLSPNITPETEGVYTIAAGGSEIIGDGYSFNKFYILGTGKAYIRGKRDAMSASFKKAEGGGESGSPEIEQEIESLRNDVNSLMNSSGLGRLAIQLSASLKRNSSGRWLKAATIELPLNTNDPFATRGDIFNGDNNIIDHAGYYSFIIVGRTYDITQIKFFVNDFYNADSELAALYIADDNTIEIWFKNGTTNSIVNVYSAIMYSMTNFTISYSNTNGYVSLPDNGVRISSEPMY